MVNPDNPQWHSPLGSNCNNRFLFNPSPWDNFIEAVIRNQDRDETFHLGLGEFTTDTAPMA